MVRLFCLAVKLACSVNPDGEPLWRSCVLSVAELWYCEFNLARWYCFALARLETQAVRLSLGLDQKRPMVKIPLANMARRM